jgi:hypothetical protein
MICCHAHSAAQISCAPSQASRSRAARAAIAAFFAAAQGPSGPMSAIGWLVDLPSFAPRADHLVRIIASAILGKTESCIVCPPSLSSKAE